jgi:FlaA1/EpsC-like NDP-sugar epimerase
MAFDGLALLASYFSFAVLRYEGLPHELAGHLFTIALLSVLLQWVVGSLVGIYLGRTAVASLEETVLLGLVTVGTDVVLAAANSLTDPYFIARSVPLGATFMSLFVMVLGRAAWRRHHEVNSRWWSEAAEPTLVFGAGAGGQSLVRSMLATPHARLRPVGLLDDDPWKRRLRVEGVPVLGSRSDLAAVAASTGASTLVLAIPSATPDLIRELSTDGREVGLEVKVLPTVSELLSERPTIRDVRDINVHDVLGRGPVETDVASIADYLRGRRVLVTGAGGSIGSELCRQIQEWAPAELVMLDRDESALHAVQLSMHGRALLDTPDVVLANIRDADTLTSIFVERRPEVVFHAAALKHLPMLEQYPAEAMKTNVWATLNVLEAAAASGVDRFVNISTDKAANPCSVLGYSKRLSEGLTAGEAADAAGTYLSVRFGNVLGSRGSVLTAFAAQIAAGGPVTVTDPRATRYFMTIQEAVQLVIQAAVIGADGEVLILDMGQPVSIESVARQLIDLSGKRIEVEHTGLRAGEKLQEELFGQGESDVRPRHPLISHTRAPRYDARLALDLNPWTSTAEITEAMREDCRTMLEHPPAGAPPPQWVPSRVGLPR